MKMFSATPRDESGTKKQRFRQRLLCFVALISTLIYAVYIVPTNSYALAYENSRLELEKELTSEIDNQLKQIDFTALDLMLQDLNSSTTPIINLADVTNSVKKVLVGEISLEYDNIFSLMLTAFTGCIKKYIPLMLFVLGVAITCSLLGKIKSKDNEKSLNDITNFVCLSLVIVAIGSCVKNLLTTTSQTITSIRSQMNAVFPILLTLAVSVGSTNSVGLYKPAVALLTSGVSQLFVSFVLPLFILSIVFTLVGNLSNSIKLDKVNSFISSLFKWVVGVTFTVFFAVISIQGISASTFDSVSIRTAKFTIKSYVPIMGGYLTEGFDLILSSSLLIKNGVGIVGMIILLSTIINPILELAIFSLLLKLTCAIMQPLCDDKLVKMLDGVSKSLNILSTTIIVLSFMYLLMMGMIMATAGSVFV